MEVSEIGAVMKTFVETKDSRREAAEAFEKIDQAFEMWAKLAELIEDTFENPEDFVSDLICGTMERWEDQNTK